ncbi:MAG: hypothetical protein EA352_11885 [Gemmatimonadales bacterium]|nr:MAG: hypothetical protein EA352_11885 [Gemmatimonadales bacterium]
MPQAGGTVDSPTLSALAPDPVRDVRIPAILLTHLRRAVRKAVGTLNATHVLHEAGHDSGPTLLGGVLESLHPDGPGAASMDAFFGAVTGHLRQEGWGTMELQRVHPGLAVLESSNWAEADPDGSEQQPGCAFTCGLLAWLFSRVSPGRVAVLEVACRSRGDDACRFLFGAEEAVHDVYGLLLDGASLESALERI